MTKKIVIPVDGSKNALKSLDYLDLIYGPNHKIDLHLFHVLPSLPPILSDEEIQDKKLFLKRANIEKKNTVMAEWFLSEAKTILIKKGYKEERIKTVFQKKQMSIARDISNWAYREKAEGYAFDVAS
jgi:hypothetical protein